jgi:cellulose synthase/poly-beta-1,6-N-acetylglucosamine synthase-like glycosyltransferase
MISADAVLHAVPAMLVGTVASAAVLALYTAAVFVVMCYTLGQFHLLYFYLRRQTADGGRQRADGGRQMADGTRRLPAMNEWPAVTVQIPMYNERYVAADAIDACAAMDYPRDRFELQIVDDSDDDTRAIIDERCALWRSRGVRVQVARRANRAGYKAGALAAATASASGEIISIFDADFRPRTDFLRLTVPYFADPAVGAVQARWGHLNRDFSHLTRAQTLLHDAFFLVEQEARDRAGLFIRFNGSAGLWRKAAIADAGGWQADTISEDLDLCLRAQLKGWKFVYTRAVEAPAEIPVSVRDFKVQQVRWTKGRGQVIRKLLPTLLRAELPLLVKSHAVFDLLNVFLIPSIFVIALLSPWFILDLRQHSWMASFVVLFGVSQVSVVLVPWFSWLALKHYGGSILGTAKEFARTFPPFVFLLVGSSLMMCVALADGLRGGSAVFHRTAKYNVAQRAGSTRAHSYSPRGIPPLTWLEGMLALYFVTALALDVPLQAWGFMPFHVSLTVGFTTMFALSALRDA